MRLKEARYYKADRPAARCTCIAGVLGTVLNSLVVGQYGARRRANVDLVTYVHYYEVVS